MMIYFEEDNIQYTKLTEKGTHGKILDRKSIKSQLMNDVKLTSKNVNERNMTIKGYSMGLYR